MSRSYSAGSLVRLPRLTALTAARLLQELLFAADAEKKPPATLAADRAELASSYEALSTTLGKRLAGEDREPAQIAAADAVEDNAFGGLVDWLRALARLPAERHAGGAEAQSILDTVFPDGLAFIALRPADEWQEAEIRRGLLADKGHEATIKRLGGGAFLDEIERAHAAYGEALGITAPRAEPETRAVRDALDAARDAIRSYVLRVSAHARRSDPASVDLAARLLQPLTTWRDRAQRGDAAPGAPAAPPPAAPAAPPTG